MSSPRCVEALILSMACIGVRDNEVRGDRRIGLANLAGGEKDICFFQRSS